MQRNESITVRSVLELSTDVLFVVGYVVIVKLVFSNLVSLPPTARALLGLPFVFFLPGYALLMLLFPGGTSRWYLRGPTKGIAAPISSRSLPPGLDWGERVALSFGTSIALLPVLGTGLAVAGLGYTAEIVVTTLGAVIVGGTLLGGVRRLQLGPDERFRVPVLLWLDEYSAALFDADTRLDAALNVLIVCLVVASLSTLAYGVVATSSAESYTQMSLLQETDQGEFVTSGYPREFTAGEGQQLYVGIDNYEGEQTRYTVVAEFQRTSANGQDILERDHAGRFTVSIDAGGSDRIAHTATPELTGENVKLVYYLYRGDAPDTPTSDSAYRSVYIWVDVVEPEAGGGGAGGEPA